MQTFQILNGDGIPVGQYDRLDHAIGAARDFAASAAADGDHTNFYSIVSDSVALDYDASQLEFRSEDFTS